ncbi:MAG: competence/damage-inducible protein A [Bacteroidetes bacterium]|nr:competence/damage-inducible protein A [Bacteroidota bacterium]
MNAELLTIGNEILIGQIVNTNAVWMAQQLNMAGISVVHMSSVADEKTAILKAFEDAGKRADLVLITGGLGPTKDDITKKLFSSFFDKPLVTDEEVLADVSAFFEKRGRPLTEINRRQAEVPEGCFVIRNKNGTAPGMWMEKDNTIYVSMPGVPFEMKAMVTEVVIPELQKRFTLPFIYHKTILTQGIGESMLAELISDWEDTLADKQIGLAYLPSPGMVRLRLSSKGTDSQELRNRIDTEVERVKPLIQKYIYGYEAYGEEQPLLEEIVGKLLRENKLKLALAESCTGGYISHLITGVAGSSDYFNGCIVPYHNEFKHQLLKVDPAIFTTEGAVSKSCVIAMAEEVKRVFQADASIAVSGIAGPGGGTDEKPVGTVWIAVSVKDQIFAKKFIFGEHRGRNIHMTAITAMNILRKMILKESLES